MRKILSITLCLMTLITQVFIYPNLVSADSTYSKTYSKLLVENYEGLTEDEKSLLNSGALDVASECYEYSKPTNDFVHIDADNKSVCFDSISPWTISDTATATWSDSSADFALTNGTGSFNSIACGNQYTISSTYNLSYAMDKDVQNRLLNAGYYIKDGYDKLEACSANVIFAYIQTLIDYKNDIKGYNEDIENIAALKPHIEKYKNKTTSGVEFLLSEDGKAFSTAARKATYSVTHLYNAFELTKDFYVSLEWLNQTQVDAISLALKNISMELLTALDYETEESFNTKVSNGSFTTTYGNFKAVLDDEWGVHTYATGTIVTNYDGIDNLIKDKNFNLHSNSEMLESLKVDEVTVKGQTNQFVVTIKVKGKYEKNNVLVDFEEEDYELTLAKDTSAKDVNDQVKNGSYLTDTATKWEIDLDKFDVKYNELSSSLTSDTNFVIELTPKKYTVKKWNDTNVDLYYGYELELPTYASENSNDNSKEYDYTVDGTVYAEGSKITIVKDTTITREEGKAYTKFSLGTVIAQSAEANTYFLNILSSKALNFSSLKIRTPDDNDGLLSTNGNYLYAKNYLTRTDSNGNKYYWTATSATYIDSANKEKKLSTPETLTDSNKFDLSGITYKSITVNYELTIDEEVISLEDAKEDLQLGKDLVEQAIDQLSFMDDLCAQKDNINKADTYIPTLVTIRNSLYKDLENRRQVEIDAVNAVLDLYDKCYDALNKKSYISSIIEEYQAIDSNDLGKKLAYFYENYDLISEQVNILAEDLNIIIKVDTLGDLLDSNGFGEYKDQIDDVSTKMSEIQEKVDDAKPNENINIESNYLESLTSAIVDGIKDGEIISELDTVPVLESVKLSTSLSKESEQYISLKFLLNIYDNDGEVIASEYINALQKEANAGNELILDDSFIKNIENEVNDYVIKKLDNVKQHYELKENISLSKTYKKSTTIIVDYVPVEYTVNFEGSDELESVDFTYVSADNRMKIDLPTDSEYDYTFEIDGNSVSASSYTFTKDQVNRLFYDENNNKIDYTISYTKISKDKNNILTIIDNMNKDIQNFGGDSYSYPVSDFEYRLQKYGYIPLEDEDGELDTILLRLTPKNIDGRDLLSMMILSTGQSAAEISFGVYNEETREYDYEVYNNKDTGELSIQAVLDMILSCGVSFKDAYSVHERNDDGSYKLDDNGNTIINETDYSNLNVAYHNNYYEANGGKKTFINVDGEYLETTVLGHEIIRSKIKFNLDGEEYIYNFGITLEDFGIENDFYDLIDTLLDINDKVEVVLSRNGINLSSSYGNSYYGIALAGLILSDQCDLDDVNGMDPNEVVDYFIQKVLKVFNEKDDDGNYTLTEAKFNELLETLGVSTSDTTDTIYKYATMIIRNMKLSYEDEIPNIINGEDVDKKKTYQTKLTLSLKELFKDEELALPEQVLNALTEKEKNEGLSLYIRATYDDLNNDYKVMTVDYKAFDTENLKSIKNTIKFYKSASEVNTTNANTYVVLLANVDELKLNSNCILNLNGHSINTLIVKANELRVVDSKYSKDNSIDAINTNGTNIHIGCSSVGTLNGKAFSESDLKASYIIDDTNPDNKRIVNKYYEIEVTSTDDIAVKFDFSELNLIKSKEDVAYTDILYSLAFELSLNVYKDWSLNIDGQNIYSLTQDDLVDVYEQHLSAFDITDINRWVKVSNAVEDVEDILNNVLNFDSLNKNLNTSDGKVYECEITSSPWDFEITALNDKLTANLISANKVKTRNLTVYVKTDSKEKQFVEELAAISDTAIYLSVEDDGIVQEDSKTGRLTINVDNNETEKTFVDFDFTKSIYSYVDYAVAVATIVGGGCGDNNIKTAAKIALEEYYESGNINALYNCINNFSIKNLTDALDNFEHQNAFSKFADNLGLKDKIGESVYKLVNLYEEVFVGASKVLKENLGSNNKLSSYVKSYGYYEFDLNGSKSYSKSYEGYTGKIILNYSGHITARLLPDEFDIDVKDDNNNYLYRGNKLSYAINSAQENYKVYINSNQIGIDKDFTLDKNVELVFSDGTNLYNLKSENDYKISINSDDISLTSNKNINIRNFKSDSQNKFVVESYDETSGKYTYKLDEFVVLIKNSIKETVCSINKQTIDLADRLFKQEYFDNNVKEDYSIYFYGNVKIQNLVASVSGASTNYNVYIYNSEMIDQIKDDQSNDTYIILNDLNETLIIEGEKALNVKTTRVGYTIDVTKESLDTYTNRWTYKLVSSVPNWDKITVTSSTSGLIAGYKIDEDNKYIYIDTVANGISEEQFINLVHFIAKNPNTDKALDGTDGGYEYTFTKVYNDQNHIQVGTGDKISVKAYINTDDSKKNYNEEELTYTIIVMGDLDHNGTNNSTDSTCIKNYYLYDKYSTDAYKNDPTSSFSKLSILAGNIDQSGPTELTRDCLGSTDATIIKNKWYRYYDSLSGYETNLDFNEGE